MTLNGPMSQLSLASVSWLVLLPLMPGLYPLPSALTEPAPTHPAALGSFKILSLENWPYWSLMQKKKSLLKHSSNQLLALTLYLERDVVMCFPKPKNTCLPERTLLSSYSQASKPRPALNVCPISRTQTHTGSGQPTCASCSVSGFQAFPVQL